MSSVYILTMICCMSILVTTSWISKKIHGSWFFPGAFFPLIWTLYMSISLISAPEFQPKILGTIIITLFAVVFSVGANIIPFQENEQALESNINISMTYYSGVFISMISALGIGMVVSMGFSWYQLEQSLFNIYVMPNLFALERYNEVLAIPTRVKMVMFLTYPAALISGFVYPFLKGFKKVTSFLPIMITMIYGTLFAVRSGILLAIILTFAGMTCAKVYLRGNLQKWFHKVSAAGAALGLLLFSTYILLQWLRGGPESIFIIDELIQGAKAGILGSFSAFTIWFSNYDFLQHYAFGVNTFAAPMEILGLTERASGFYTDFIPIGPSVTNIYSAFRGIITDFGIIGSFIFFIIMGLGSALAYKSSWNGNQFAVVPLSIFYAFTLFSPLISIFTFNSIIIAFIMFYGILFISKVQAS